MEEIIDRIRQRVGLGQFQSESAVRETIVLPILQALGWDIFDPSSVLREYTLGTRRVDYALSSSARKTEIFIEVKAVGHTVGADKQLFEYAFHEGIPFAILTDGREWNFFLPGEQGSYEERRVQKLDLTERSPKEAVDILQRYLEISRVRSGAAIESARADYQNVSKRRTAAGRISSAWQELVNGRDEFLMDILAEKTEAICGYRPASEDVEEFLLGLTPTAKPTLRQPLQPTPVPSQSTSTPLTSERSVQYRLYGESRNANNAIDALVDILRRLSSRNPQFIERLAQVATGRTRHYVAKSRDDLYPQKPELTEYAIELVPGWWLGTNISNRTKMNIIEQACGVEGLTLGKDVVIQLPNVK